MRVLGQKTTGEDAKRPPPSLFRVKSCEPDPKVVDRENSARLFYTDSFTFAQTATLHEYFLQTFANCLFNINIRLINKP